MRTLLASLWFTVLLATPGWAITVTTGQYTGDGLDNKDIVTSPACQPVAVFVIRNSAGRDLYTRFASMGANVSRAVTAGVAEVTDGIKSFNSDGFRLGTNVAVNGSGVTHYYVTICDNGANDVATNTWSGDNSDNKDVTISPAFTPEFVMVLENGTGTHYWRGGTSHSGDAASVTNAAAADSANEIQSFASTGFQVGTGKNTTGETYYSLALKGSTGVGTGSYTGNTSDDRSITAIANPKFVGIKGNSTTNQMAYRPGTIAGDASFCDTGAAIANLIQALESTGFQVGTHTCANENTVTMRWFAFTTFVGRTGRPSAVIFQ